MGAAGIALVVIAGFSLLIVVVSVLIMMFVLFNYGQTQGQLKTVTDQTFLQSQLNNARLMSVEQTTRYLHDVVQREEQAQSMLSVMHDQGMMKGKVMYQNEDGSIKADSLPDLLDKMNKDSRYNPQTPETPQADQDFLEGLFNPYPDEDEDEEDAS